jgi:hypothetical protein
MFQLKDCKKHSSRLTLAHKGWIFHAQSSGKIPTAPEQSGDISALTNLVGITTSVRKKLWSVISSATGLANAKSKPSGFIAHCAKT